MRPPYKPPYDEELIRAELDKLAMATPAIIALCISSTDLWTIASSIKPANQSTMISIAGYFSTLDSHMEANFKLGGWQQMISAASEGIVINLPFQVTCALILVVQPDTALDDLFSTIEPYYESLLKYF